MKRSWTDQLKQTKELFSKYWIERSSKQKWLIIGTFVFLVAALSIFVFMSSRPQYVPLYTGQLSQREVGDIKAELDKEGNKNYKISDNGTMLLVPKKDAANLVVSLASKGYPKDNTINYDVFSQNLSFGATDRQYDVLEREAMQNQVANVLKHVDGIKNAEVILTLPQNSVFIKQDQQQKATASVMVQVAPGTQLNSQQIRALYTLVSKSVPNLPMENITIMNQYSETLALQDSSDGDQSLSQYDQQRKIQQNIQQDIQQSIQSLLGTVLGTDKVYVQTLVKMNFDKVKTEEKLVKPTDKNNNGIVISSDKSATTYDGNGASAGGVTGTGATDVPGYPGSTSGGNGHYEQTQDKVNYEVNRINNEIIKSPYQIDDITINVGVEPDSSSNKLSKATEDNVRNIVSNTVQTALGHPNLSQKEIDDRITIFPHQFANNTAFKNQSSNNGLYIGLGVAAGALLIGGLIWWLVRRKKQNQLEVEQADSIPHPAEVTEYFEEQDMSVESQLKKLVEQRPEDFSKIIRTWLHDEEV
ncbi:flagellar basal-body MS-ring/collar protein FliF [Neobacillus massiliamazoniensis]|uniref:Flagellar M-ring protein n=1 Tax=Neobacillus massiliamazoniensis TaxID=1499688 RepID=A0A0U1NS88_9BACI|nr:flagellar basal-body MS-ring/collar protein FliF [Neobacillus massiliamazoniensis]CRK80911.1 flagellar MS-ring protein [Neobacillus massiliamazoniensis]